MAAVNKITPSNPRLSSLLSEIETGNIKIPVFQREFVWDDEQIMSLLDSIYRGFPVGSILLWSTKEELKTHRNVGGFHLPDVPADYPVKYVLDGQQRLTTLYAVFHSDDKVNDREQAKKFDVSFQPSTETFVHSSKADPAVTINMRVVLDASKLLPELPRFNPAEQKVIAALTERFKDYEFPVVTIKERTNREVCQIFQRINSSGTKLSTLDLLTAWTWSDDFDLRDRIAKLTDQLSQKGFEEIDERQILRCIAAVVRQDIDSDALVDTSPADLVAAMKKVEQGMSATVDFLSSEFGVRNLVFLPFPIMLVPLVAFFAEQRNPSAAQRKLLRQWFWHCVFVQRFAAGTTTAVLEDLVYMRGILNSPATQAARSGKVDHGLFLATFRINSTAAKATICLLAQLQPRSFVTGAPVDLDRSLEAYNSRQFHHIFPKAHVMGVLGLPFHKANVISNVCMLTAADNNLISDDPPYVYSAHIPASIRADVLARALLEPTDFDPARGYDAFIVDRAKRLAVKAQELLDNG